MSTAKTEKLSLHAWAAEDSFLREEVNQNFSALDAAVGAKCQMVYGSYVGDGALTRVIDLGFTPAVVVLNTNWGETYRYPDTAGGIFTADSPLMAGSSAKTVAAQVVEGGFQLNGSTNANSYTNWANRAFNFVAFR